MSRAHRKATLRRLMGDGRVMNVAEIAEALDWPTSTVRYWLDRTLEIERLPGPGYPQYQLRQHR